MKLTLENRMHGTSTTTHVDDDMEIHLSRVRAIRGRLCPAPSECGCAGGDLKETGITDEDGDSLVCYLYPRYARFEHV